MAKKNSKSYIIKIYCVKCSAFLYEYRKEGKGHLVKCYKDGIIKDNTKGDLRCPQCAQLFARDTMYHNRPANKIIQGKVYVER